MANRLANESSPYLLQHKDNPVDWYPWGPEALERARREDLPVLLSVGYSSCHWCHVMEHESFADAGTARLMNERFVNIKVDREERPDVDALYMQAVQQMTGHGGWPMTVFLTPDGTPFYGGTYFPPEPRHGLPSFKQILLGVADAYHERREEVERSAAGLLDSLRKGMGLNPEPTGPQESLLRHAFHRIGARFDESHGGFGDAPKFPQPMVLDFLLRYWARSGSREALDMVERTLEAMARGGIHDQIGGGFHRYTVDARWLVPHFEKMLYDNALLARSYVRAHQATGRQDFRVVAEGILRYVQREMTSPDGGFFSSQDADSEGEEGRFYVWTAGEIDDLLGPEEGPVVRRYFGVTEAGNWEGKSILCRDGELEEVARDLGIATSRVEEILTRGKETLYEARSRRIWPGLDDKVLTSWNAMMLQAFAEAARVLDDHRHRDAAVRNAEFLLRELRPDGRLLRSWRDGTARIDAFLEDHGLLVDALVELYGTTFEVRWLREARALADQMLDRFWSPEEEAFFDSPADGEPLVVRPRDLYDNATPSGNSAAVHALQRLARLTGEPRYERVATTVISRFADAAAQVPQAFGHLLAAVDHHLAPPMEVAIVGSPGASDTAALLDVLRSRFLPNTTVALRPTDSPDPDPADEIPLLADRSTIQGRATAFVCRRYTCRSPVDSPDELVAEIDAATTSAP